MPESLPTEFLPNERSHAPHALPAAPHIAVAPCAEEVNTASNYRLIDRGPNESSNRTQTVTLDCFDDSRDNWLRAAVAVQAPITNARKLEGGRIELTLNVPDHIWNAAGGAKGYERQVFEMLVKLRRVSERFPGLLDGALNSHDTQCLRVRQDSRSKCYYLSAKFPQAAAAHAFQDAMNALAPGWALKQKEGADGAPLYYTESTPSAPSYFQQYGRNTAVLAFDEGLKAVKAEISQMVRNHEIDAPRRGAEWAKQTSTDEKFLQLTFGAMKTKPGSATPLASAKKLLKKLASHYRLKRHQVHLVQDKPNPAYDWLSGDVPQDALRTDLLLSHEAITGIGREILDVRRERAAERHAEAVASRHLPTQAEEPGYAEALLASRRAAEETNSRAPAA